MIAYLESSGPRQALWHDAMVPVSSTLAAAVRSLDATGLQIALIVDPDGQLIGTLTDGDIRRALLRGVGLDAPVTAASQPEPLVVPPHLARKFVYSLMQANRIRHLPVVDAEHRVVGMHLLDDVAAPAARETTIVVMAGGRGTRLMPHTEHCPKPMVPVNGRPMLEHIVERARGEGFSRFVVAIHHLGHMIESHFGDGSDFGVSISYLRETQPLGTAGALSLLSERPTGPFIVTNGDVLTDVRYAEMLDFHLRQGATATMAVRQHEWVNPFGVVRTRGVELVGFDEKPVTRSHINAGIYVLEPRALDVLEPNDRCDMPLLFSRLISLDLRTIAYPMHEPWLDVGRPTDLEQAQVLRAPVHLPAAS